MFKLIPHVMVTLLCVAVAPAQAASADDFGRLFSRPAEREKLDKLRQNHQLKVAAPSNEDAPQEGDAEPVENVAPIAMQGYVKRSDGKGTLWINSQAVQEGDSVDNVQIGRINRRGFSSKAPIAEGVDVQAGSKKIRLKAGQVYEPETSQIRELQIVEKARRLKLENAGVSGGNE